MSAVLEGERAENTDPRIIQHERELALAYATRFLTNPSLGSKDRLTQANQKELDTHFIPDMLREYRDSMAET